MKQLNHTLQILLCLLLTQGLFAQKKQMESERGERIYTPAQIEMIKEQRRLIKADKDAFRATLSKEQLAVFKNEDLNREERRKVLKEMLTPVQKELLASNKAKAKALREKFKATITAAQKEALKKRRQKLREKRHKRHENGEKRHHHTKSNHDKDSDWLIY